VTNFLYVLIYKRSNRAALGPFLLTLVFISTIIEVSHAIKRVSHVYAVAEKTMVQSMLSSQLQCMFYAIGVMVPWFDGIAYNAVMCSLRRFYGNEGMQPDNVESGLKKLFLGQKLQVFRGRRCFCFRSW
jgi:hypothetical protein